MHLDGDHVRPGHDEQRVERDRPVEASLLPEIATTSRVWQLIAVDGMSNRYASNRLIRTIAPSSIRRVRSFGQPAEVNRWPK